MTRKMLIALSVGLACGLSLLPLQAQSQMRSGTMPQSLPQDWIQQVVKLSSPEQRLQALRSFIQTYQLRDRLLPGSILEPLLKDSSAQVRTMAIRLMNPYDSTSLPLIVAALDDPDETVLLQAIGLLTSIKGYDSAPYLFRFLEHGPVNAEAAAISIMGRYKHPESLPRLVKGMTRYGANVLTPALSGPLQEVINDNLYNAYFSTLREYPAQKLLALLRPALVASETGVRLMAFKLLYYLEVPEVQAPLLAWVRTAPDNLKQAILNLILIRYPVGGGDPLPTQNPDILAEMVSWSMKKEESPLQQTAWRYLHRRLRYRDEGVEKIIEPYMQHPETLKQLLNLLPYGSAANDPQLSAKLFQNLASADSEIVLLSIRALNGLNSEEFDTYLSKLLQTHPKPEITSEALNALSTEPRNQSLVKVFLHDPDPSVRATALNIMSHYTPQQILPERETLLKLFQNDTDQNVRLSAFNMLCQLKDEGLISQLIERVITLDAEHASEYIKSIKAFCPKRPEFLYPFLKLGPADQLTVVDALIDWKASQAASHLAPLLNQTEPRLQDQILNFIRITEPDAEGVKAYIIPLLSSSDPQIQASAFSAWGALKNLESDEQRGAIPTSSLNSASQETRVAALSLLTMDHGVATDLELFTRHVLQETKQPYDFAGLIDRLDFAQDPQALFPLLDHPDQRIRDSLVRWLKQHASHEVVPALRRYVPKFSPEGQASAIEVIGAIGDRQEVSWIKPFLKSPEADVRKAAILALGELRNPEAGGLATTLLDDVNPATQLVAVRTLQALRMPEAVPGLLKALSRPLEDTRREALLALRKIDAREALPDVMQIFSKQSVEDLQFGCIGFPQRSWAIHFLSDLVKKESLAAFVNNVKPEDLYYQVYDAYHSEYAFNRVTVADILAEQALPQNLLPFLNDPRPLVRSAIAASLANYPDPQWIPALQARLKQETDPQVKLAIQLSLGQLGDRQVMESLKNAFQQAEFKEKVWEIGITLIGLRAPDIQALFRHKLELEPEEYAVWRLLSVCADESTLVWLKQMANSQNPNIRNKASSALQEARRLRKPQSREQPPSVHSPHVDAKFEQRLSRYLKRLDELKGHPDAMLRLAYDFLDPSTFDDRKNDAWRTLAVRDSRFKPVLIPLLAEGVNKDRQFFSSRNWAMSALSGLKLSPEDPLFLNLIQSLPSKDNLALRLFQAKLWYEQGQPAHAIADLTDLLSDARLQSYPAYRVKALHLLSDFSAEPNRLEFLNQAVETIKHDFKEVDYQEFEDLPEMLTELRRGSVLLSAQEPYQAQIAYQRALDELYTHYGQGNILLTPFGALMHAGLAEAAIQLKQEKLAQAHLILALEFWQRRDGWGVQRSDYFTDHLPVRHSPNWAYEKLCQLLKSSGNTDRLSFFQARFGRSNPPDEYLD